MKISINVEPGIKDNQVSILCGSITPEIEKLIAMMRILDRQLAAVKDGETYLLEVSRIVYIESVDRKTFVYTQNDCFESRLKLYELEEALCECGFFRASKSCIVQLKYIKSLRSDIDRKIRVTLENGEQIMVSRQYADELKRKLGVM